MLEAAGRFLGQPVQGPSLDLGCTDGVPTFVMLGGEFGLDFDVYTEVAWTKDLVHWSSLGDDYFNTFEIEGVRAPDVTTRPAGSFDVGLSWKRAHIEKASRLGVYRRLVECDPNRALTMFEDRSVATIWAPNLYWLDNIEGALSECARILRSDGRIVTAVPDVTQLDQMLYRFVDRTDGPWIRDLDRGRYENTARQARDLAQWVGLFGDSRLQVKRHECIIPALVGRVYDIGFRPMFPVLMHMYETLRECGQEKLTALKKHWIDTAYYFLAPLCDLDWMDRMNDGFLWHVFELEPWARREGEPAGRR